jgi:hypothetical protein
MKVRVAVVAFLFFSIFFFLLCLLEGGTPTAAGFDVFEV